MPKFVTGKELEDTVYDILFQAKTHLLLMSPYIKLDDYFKELLANHTTNPHLRLVVVFGKNEGQVWRSVSRQDLAFFQQFHYVTLIYAPNLHAKFYGNERQGVITSINLYDYSFKHNIEFGICTESTAALEHLTQASTKKTLDKGALAGAVQVAQEHNVIYAKRPAFKRSGLSKLLGGFVGGKDFTGSHILFDALDALLDNRPYASKRLADIADALDFGQPLATVRPTREEVEGTGSSSSQGSFRERETSSRQGYCIRTGTPIPYDPERPFSYEAYRTWVQFGDADYPERYCHRTGQASHGKTSMRQPILA